MAGVYLFPGSSKSDESSHTQSPPISLECFSQVYARQDDPVTEIDDEYFISIERFIMAPHTKRVAFSEALWDAKSLDPDVLVSFIPGFQVKTNVPPLGISVRIYLCVKTIRIHNRLSEFNVRAFLRNIEKPFTNSVSSTDEQIFVQDKSRRFQNIPWIKDALTLEDDVCHLLLRSLCDYGLMYEKNTRMYLSHFPWTTLKLCCLHPTAIAKPSHLYVHALSDLWMLPKKGKCCNCSKVNVDVKASFTYPHVKSEPLLCVPCQRLNKKFKLDMDKAMMNY